MRHGIGFAGGIQDTDGVRLQVKRIISSGPPDSARLWCPKRRFRSIKIFGKTRTDGIGSRSVNYGHVRIFGCSISAHSGRRGNGNDHITQPVDTMVFAIRSASEVLPLAFWNSILTPFSHPCNRPRPAPAAHLHNSYPAKDAGHIAECQSSRLPRRAGLAGRGGPNCRRFRRPPGTGHCAGAGQSR